MDNLGNNEKSEIKGFSREAAEYSRHKIEMSGNTDISESPPVKEGESFIRWLIYLRKYKRVVIVTFLIFFASGVLYTFLSPKYYEAKASFFFPVPSQGGDLLSSLGLSGLLNPAGDLSTYAVSILQGTTVSNNVIDKFGPQLFGKDAKKPRVELLKRLPWIVKVKLSPSKIVEITVITKDPKLSADIANFYVEEYIRFSKSSNLTLATQHRKNIEKQRNKVKKELYGLENKLLAFQNKEKVVDPPAELQSMLNYYANIKAMSVTANVNYSQSKTKLDSMRQKMAQQAVVSGERAELSQMLGNPAVSAVYQQIVAKEMELAKQLQTKSEDNPVVRALEDEIANLRKNLKTKVSSHLAGVQSDIIPSLIEAYAESISQKAKTQALEEIIKDLDRKFEEIPELTYSYRRLNRDVLIKEKLLGYLELEVEKARSEEFRNPNEIQILDKAIPPDFYCWPIRRWCLLGTLVLSSIFALIAAKVADTYNNFRRAVED